MDWMRTCIAIDTESACADAPKHDHAAPCARAHAPKCDLPHAPMQTPQTVTWAESQSYEGETAAATAFVQLPSQGMRESTMYRDVVSGNMVSGTSGMENPLLCGTCSGELSPRDWSPII